MQRLELAEDTFVVADLGSVVTAFLDPVDWRRWWPRLELEVAQDRGPVGVRWRVSGEVQGTGELWLEPVMDGVVVHWFLRGSCRGRAARTAARYRRDWRRVSFGLKDRLEAGRPPGVKPRGQAAE
jgi:hypothetical protein